MGNESGRAYGLTVLSPIKAGTEGGESFASLTRKLLQDLDLHELSPMAKVPNTYLCRFLILDDVIYQGKPALLEGLKSRYLVFVAELHGKRDAYVEGMWSHAESFVREAWKYCVDFESVNSPQTFARYIKRCQVETTLYFNGSNDEPLAEQLKALYLHQEFSRFAFESAKKSAADLQSDFQQFVARTQPTNLAAPTWRAGADELDDIVVGMSEDSP